MSIFVRSALPTIYCFPLFKQVGADNVRALYKRNLELDNIKKELEIKKLEIELLEYEKKVFK